MIIQTGKSEIDILKCREVIFELRPHLEQQYFLATIQEMISEGYQFDFIEEERYYTMKINCLLLGDEQKK